MRWLVILLAWTLVSCGNGEAEGCCLSGGGETVAVVWESEAMYLLSFPKESVEALGGVELIPQAVGFRPLTYATVDDSAWERLGVLHQALEQEGGLKAAWKERRALDKSAFPSTILDLTGVPDLWKRALRSKAWYSFDMSVVVKDATDRNYVKTWFEGARNMARKEK